MSEPYPFDRSVIWHVVFQPREKRDWWAGQYRHVSLAGYCNDTWFHIDVQRTGFGATAIYHYEDVQDFLSYLLTYYTVVRFGPARGGSRQFLMPMTCVSFVKHVLGVRSGALRPDGLLRTLVRDYGAEIVGEPQQAPGDAGAETAEADGQG